MNQSSSPCTHEHRSCKCVTKEPLPHPRSPSTHCLLLVSQPRFYKQFSWESLSALLLSSFFVPPLLNNALIPAPQNSSCLISKPRGQFLIQFLFSCLAHSLVPRSCGMALCFCLCIWVLEAPWSSWPHACPVGFFFAPIYDVTCYLQGQIYLILNSDDFEYI